MSKNNLLLEKIKKIDIDQNLVTIIMDHLHLSKSQAYRRLKGVVEFTLSEAAILINIFDIPPNEIFVNEKSINTINFNASLRINSSYFDFLQNLQQVIQRVGQLPDAYVQHTSNEFPTFYLFLSPSLIKFKIYMWNNTFWQDKGRNNKFKFENIPPEEIELANEIKEAYLDISTTEYWNLRLTDNTLNQIQYALESGLFENPEDAIGLAEDLRNVYREVANMAQIGQKKLSRDKSLKVRGKFQLYLSELPTNIHFLVTHQKGQSLYTTFDKPNFFYTENKATCNYINSWMENLKSKSVLISETGDRTRNKFFHRLDQGITNFTQKIIREN